MLLGLIGLLLSFRYQRAAKIIIIVAFSGLWLLSTPIVAWHLINGLQNQYPAIIIEKLSHKTSSGVIIILGAGSHANAQEYKNQHSVSDTTLSRLNYAAYLYDHTHLPLLASGGGDKSTIYSTAELMQQTFKNNFHLDIQWLENRSQTTADEAKLLTPFLKKHKFEKVYLVTNAWHMPRSVYAFQQAGIAVIPAPMGYVAQMPPAQISYYLPSILALRTTNIAIHEYIGLWWYRLSAVYYVSKFKP
jgi:uncharacterized SAM-binding protein YcdF (DUF218 family)